MAILSAAYLSSTAKVGDTVFVGVLLDTGGVKVDGVDVILALSSHLKPVKYFRANLFPLMDFYQFGTDNSVKFSQLCNGGEPLAIKGLLAVIQCEVLSTGYANIRFDFVAGATNDSNVAANGGQDILTEVVNRRITITN